MKFCVETFYILINADVLTYTSLSMDQKVKQFEQFKKILDYVLQLKTVFKPRDLKEPLKLTEIVNKINHGKKDILPS